MCEWGVKANESIERELEDMKVWINKIEERLYVL